MESDPDFVAKLQPRIAQYLKDGHDDPLTVSYNALRVRIVCACGRFRDECREEKHCG